MDISKPEAKEDTAVPIMEEDEPEPSTIREAYHDLKNAQTADEKAKYFNIIYSMICTSKLITTFLFLLNLFPLYILIVGSIYLHQCPVQYLIPIYMIVEGVFFLVRTIIFWYFRWRHDQEHETTAKPAWPNYLAHAFLFVWLICGSVWIFSNYHPNFENEQSPNYCNKLLYISAFVYVIMKWVAFPIGLIIGCCILTSAAIAHKARAKSAGSPVLIT